MLLHRLFGFFFGSTLTGAGIYYYVLDEYRLSNELLTEDIYVSTSFCPITPRVQAQSLAQLVLQRSLGMKDIETMMIELTLLQTLQAAVQRVHTYVETLEAKLEALEKKH